jgi:hypothetical protein
MSKGKIILPKIRGYDISIDNKTGKIVIKRKDFKKISTEQRERFSAALKCLELAQATDLVAEERSLVKIACEYGSGMGLSKRECEKVLDMQVRDLIRLGI